jgi:hypothetical protein
VENVLPVRPSCFPLCIKCYCGISDTTSPFAAGNVTTPQSVNGSSQQQEVLVRGSRAVEFGGDGKVRKALLGLQVKDD